MTTSPGTAPGSAVRNRLIAIVAVLLAVVVLRMTRSVVLPVVAGLLVAALMWPVLRWWQQRIPRPLALLATVLLVVLAILALVAGIGWGGARVGEQLMARRDRLARIEQDARAAAARIGVQLPGDGAARAPQGAGGGAAAEQEEPAPPGEAQPPRGGSYAQRVASAFFAGLGALGLTIGFMALALAEARHAGRKIEERFPASQARRMLEISQEIATTMQRYFVVKSVTSALTGLSTALIALAFGLDLAFLWGLLAFLFEYVPTIGSILAVVPPALYAAVQFDGYVRPLALTGALTVMQLFLGNYVDPRLEGRFLSLSPFVVLASIVLWAWMWGAPGALLGVPLTIAITTAARHFDGTRWIWAVLTDPRHGGEPHGTKKADAG